MSKRNRVTLGLPISSSADQDATGKKGGPALLFSLWQWGGAWLHRAGTPRPSMLRAPQGWLSQLPWGCTSHTGAATPAGSCCYSGLYCHLLTEWLRNQLIRMTLLLSPAGLLDTLTELSQAGGQEISKQTHCMPIWVTLLMQSSNWKRSLLRFSLI